MNARKNSSGLEPPNRTTNQQPPLAEDFSQVKAVILDFYHAAECPSESSKVLHADEDETKRAASE